MIRLYTRGKQGQTAYVLLGLVFLTVVGIVLFGKYLGISSQRLQEQFGAESLPQKAQKVKLFTESCLSEALHTATVQIAQQGGYLTLPEDDILPGPFNPFSNRIDIFGDGSLLVPLWTYEKANGVPAEMIPTRGSMEREISSYLSTHAPQCLENFRALKEEGYTIQYGPLQPEVRIDDDRVYATINFEVEASDNDFSYTFKKFYVSTIMPLGRLHDQALGIIETEQAENFLEQYVLDMVTVYDEIPSTSIDFECTPRSWTRTEVKETMKRVFEANLPFVRIAGSDYESSSALKEYFEVKTTTSDDATKAAFLYSSTWPFFMNVVGEEGELLRGQQLAAGSELTQVVSTFFCMNQYHFVYDISFPVLVQVTDAKGNTLQFGILVVIDNNQPKENQVENIPLFDTSSIICGNPGTSLIVYAYTPRIDNTVALLDNVDISIKCLSTTCPVGRTTQQQGDIFIQAEAPLCLNGLVIGEKEGYFKGEAQLSASQNQVVSVLLEKVYTLPVTVNVFANNIIRPIQPTETGFFMFKHLEKDFTATLVSTQAESTIDLIPGPYEITSYIVVESNPPFNLEEETLTNCFEVPANSVLGIIGITTKKCESHTIPATEIKQVVAGGGTVRWEAERNSLANARGITLYTVRGSAPTSQSQLAEVDTMLRQGSTTITPPRLNL